MRRNYYNYFTEIEEHFVKRRNKGVIISPLDWSLIETWKDTGIPLHVAIRGINRAFDSYDARPKKGRMINSIFYCHQQVLTAFEEYNELHAGGHKEDSPNGGEDKAPAQEEDRTNILDFLAQKTKELLALQAQATRDGREDFAEVLGRALKRLEELNSERQNASLRGLDYENLERDLSSLESLLLDALQKEIIPEDVKAWHQEAKKELKYYKKNLSKETYEKILKNFIHKKIRQRFGLPNLSLFYVP